MATLRRPSLLDRALSTPPLTPDSAGPTLIPSTIIKQHTGLGISTLSPPISPIRARFWSNLSDLSLTGTLKPNDSPQNNCLEQRLEERPSVLGCPYDVEILKDQQGRDQIFGRGAWSTVYRATTSYKVAASLSEGLLTPPLSPTTSTPVLVAIKKPMGRQAIDIVESEGRILTHLIGISEYEQYIVPFFGMANSSLVLAPMPLSLEHHIQKCAALTEESLSSNSMHDPVIGSSKIWLDLAYNLVSALDWLHNDAGVVHGDVKPGNILLSPRSSADGMFEYQPLFADFSSGQILGEDPTPNTLSAVTREYTAPELLSSAVFRNPNSTATTDSDVFSLAVTLLVAATGDAMVYQGSMFHRQVMATQGWLILSNVRSFANGSRVPRNGIVENVLERAVLKAGMGRIDAQTWKSLIEQKLKGEPMKKQ